MTRRPYVEPPTPTDFDGCWRVCSCGCGVKRPLTADFFGRLNVPTKNGTWIGFQYLRKMCRNKTLEERRAGVVKTPKRKGPKNKMSEAERKHRQYKYYKEYVRKNRASVQAYQKAYYQKSKKENE